VRAGHAAQVGDCVLDLRARQLERADKVVPLEPKMYDLLDVLIRRRPSVVTNNELDEFLWPEVYVARTSLTRLVSELRRCWEILRATRISFGRSTKPAMRLRQRNESTQCRRSTCHDRDHLEEQSLPLPDGGVHRRRDADCSLVIDASTFRDDMRVLPWFRYGDNRGSR